MNTDHVLSLCGEVVPGYKGDDRITSNRIHTRRENFLSRECWLYKQLTAYGWTDDLSVIKRDAATILKLVIHSTDSCRDIENKLIDRHTVHQELQILAEDIIAIVNLVFERLIENPKLDVNIHHHTGLTSIREQCRILKNQAMEMIFKFSKHDNENQVLLFLAAKLDGTCSFNHIPKDLINIFATTMFELKLNDAKKACGAI